ncbi:hypothetical protein EW145_g8040 [Phellinidium pouzarii]|uniref:GEgh 16 protein n=1 Tax=Phellinidium pouzarii TaxID=167371 RepID=A0A4S4KAP0_9AGAM|nr:hypothetical protein EW145_g8040 [Phellinidium pouzarii]
MLFSTRLTALLALALSTTSAHAHSVITNVAGANGVAAQAFGVIASTPRDGSTPVPFEQDTSIIRNQEIQNGQAGVCGRTKAGGDNDVATQLDAAVTSGLPSAAADGTVSMTLHQVNQDGAGPYTCEVSTDATGASFAAMVVSTDVPGKNSLSNAKATDFPLVAQMPAGTTCTGGANGDACLVRCRNAALAGPFGGCVAVTTSNATSTSVVDTATAATAAASADVAASSVIDTDVDTATAILSATDAAAAANAATAVSSAAAVGASVDAAAAGALAAPTAAAAVPAATPHRWVASHRAGGRSRR